MSSKGALPKTKSVTSNNELLGRKVQTRLSLSRVVDSKEVSNEKRNFTDCGCGEEKGCFEKESEDDFGFELKPKRKIACIPKVSKDLAITEVDSNQLKDKNDINVVYKSREMQESSMSVLFVGSGSSLGSPKENITE